MRIVLNPNSIDDYRRFLAVKQLPIYKVRGCEVWFPDEYAERLGMAPQATGDLRYVPSPFLFDYQRDIAALALKKKKFIICVDPGYGKTLIYGEILRTVMKAIGRRQGGLLVAPPMVIDQTIAEYQKFYGDKLPVERVASGDLDTWLQSCAGKIGITNYEAFRNPLRRGQLGILIGDELHVLASHYGKYAQGVIDLGRGLEWKFGGTGTPAPNDRIEYANYAVFLDQFPTINSFLARYFVNRGQTNERWVLKRHSLEAFYKSLSHWSIHMSHPSVFGWKDNAATIPPYKIHIQDVAMTPEQTAAAQKLLGTLYVANAGGIVSRSKLAAIAKGIGGIETLKYDHIRRLVDSMPSRSVVIWAERNAEQDMLEKTFPDAASIQGKTKDKDRTRLLEDWLQGRRKVLISKAEILGYGMNMQVSTAHIFSTLHDSWRDYYQCIKRSNRVGSTEPLDVYIPVTDIERPMVENVLRKAVRIDQDAREQAEIFKAARMGESIAELVKRQNIDLEMLVDDLE